MAGVRTNPLVIPRETIINVTLCLFYVVYIDVIYTYNFYPFSIEEVEKPLIMFPGPSWRSKLETMRIHQLY
jgi:hypothetical protein